MILYLIQLNGDLWLAIASLVVIGASLVWHYTRECPKCGHDRGHHAGHACLRCHDNERGPVGPCWEEHS
jgi:hypothetical protein